jgi:serine/threonine-protein kinase
MSPEQARGTAVDQRTDIWAFGLVLYEMLAGRPAFAGDTVTDILASVMKEQPDLDAVPPLVRPALARCLSKDRRARWGSIGDVRWALEVGQTSPPVRREPQGSRRWPWIVAAAFAAIAIVAVWGWWRLASSPEPPRTVTRSAMTAGTTFLFPALSRDGTRLAYTDIRAPYSLWLRMMDQLEGHPIPGSEGASFPAFSPDGQWIAYVKAPGPYQLKKIPVTGGTSITLCDVPGLADLFWGDDDSILFGSSKGLMRVPAAGGPPESLTTRDTKKGETGHVQPQLLPGGQAILFTIRTAGPSPDAGRVAALDLKTDAYRVIVNSGVAARYVPTGHLVYRRGAAIFAAPFDLKRLAVTGAEAPVVEGIASPVVSGNAYPVEYSFSSTGLLVFLAGGGSGSGRAIDWMDRKGEMQTLPEPPHNWGHFRLSPDGKKVAGNILGDGSNAAAGNSRTWIYDLERGILTPLTPGDGVT